MQRFALASFIVTVGLVAQAHADRVHLVGGRVIEGKATRQGDKVIVQVEEGELTLAADSVARIEAGESAVQSFEARYAKLVPGDVKGLIALADYCRDHDMRDRERELLQRVVDKEPDHKVARARLGYVHTDSGWSTREEQMRAQGMVQYNGQWVTREQLMELQRMENQAAIAAREREQAQLELEKKRVELEKEKSERDAAQAQAQAQQARLASMPVYSSFPVYNTYPGYAPYATYPYNGGYPAYAGGGCAGGRCTHGAAPKPYAHPFPIPGVKDPFAP